MLERLLKNLKMAEAKAKEAGERVRETEEKVMKAEEGMKFAEEKTKITEEMLIDLKKIKREKVDEIAQLKEKNKVLESGKSRAENDTEVWKNFFEELEKRVTLLETYTENVSKLESLATKVIARDSIESNKENGEKGTSKIDGFAVVSGSDDLPSSPTCPMNQGFPSDKKSDFEQQIIVIIDSDDESSPLRSNLHDKSPIDLTNWDIKPILAKRKRPCSPNVSGSKMRLDECKPSENRKSPSRHVQVESEEKIREDKSSPTTLNKLTVGDESDAFDFEVSSSSDSDGGVDLDEIMSESQRPI
uniref:Uncharacterized protein n=1 Tax=Cannabis sativa TaxID=3483 RepID=A0A803R6D4_CANSA